MKKISAIVGATLLIAATILAIVSNRSGSTQITTQNAIVAKYINLSANKLANGDIQGAINNAKLAIKANPADNAGFISYNAALKAQYQPNGTSTQPAIAPAAPASSSSSDDSMGC